MGHGTERNSGRGRAASRTGLGTRYRSIRLRLPTAAWSVRIVTEDWKTYQETLGQDGAEFALFFGPGCLGVKSRARWPLIEPRNAFAHGGFHDEERSAKRKTAATEVRRAKRLRLPSSVLELILLRRAESPTVLSGCSRFHPQDFHSKASPPLPPPEMA